MENFAQQKKQQAMLEASCFQHGSAAGNDPRQRALKGGAPSGKCGLTSIGNGEENVSVYRKVHGNDRSAYRDDGQEVRCETEWDNLGKSCGGRCG